MGSNQNRLRHITLEKGALIVDTVKKDSAKLERVTRRSQGNGRLTSSTSESMDACVHVETFIPTFEFSVSLVSSGTAKIVLTDRSLRWSSPVLFNDPFDVPREMSFGLTPVDIVQALSRRMADLIQNPPEDTSQLEPKVRLIVDTVKKGIPPEVRAERSGLGARSDAAGRRQFVEAAVAAGIPKGDYNGRDRGGAAGVVSLTQYTTRDGRRSSTYQRY